MKHIANWIPHKKFLYLIPLSLCALVIWYAGPHLIIANHLPLKEPQKRLALILALLLAWMTKFLFLDQLNPSKADDLNLHKMLHSLRGHFLGATKFLKKTILDKHGFPTPLNTLPWYLLIGPPGAGKTTLLTQSNINFILSKQKKQEGQEKSIPSSSVCDWWVTRDLVLVDVPGYYAFSPIKEGIGDTLQQDDTSSPAKPHTHLILWKSLLHLLIKHRQQNNIGALIIALQLPELLKQTKQQQTQWFQDIKQRLVECWAKFGKLPIYFVVTKCDLLPGFSEFFNDIGSDELMQPWGIPLSARKEDEKLPEVFTERFNALIKRLNKQLIWRLHQERNPQARPLIKDFPLQLEFLKETITHLIKTLEAVNPELDLEGVYLSSATQENSGASSSTLFHHDVPSALELLPTSPFVSRAYFIKHVISYLLPHTSNHLTQRFRQKNTWLPKVAYSTAFTLLFIGALWLGKDFQRGLYQVATFQRYLTQYQLYLQKNNSQDSTIASINNALPLLNTLQIAAEMPVQTTRLQQIETLYSTKSQKTAIAIYQKALQTIVLPQVRNEFEKYLEAASDKNPEQLYLALKAYLLLRRQEPGATSPVSSTADRYTKANFVIHTLEQISPSFNKKYLNKALILHIQNALQLKQANTLNNRLIKEARKILTNLPDTELAFILIKTMGHNNNESDFNFGTNIGTPPALISKGTATQIPYLFTASAFSAVMKQDIPLAAEETILGNEVLGKKFIRADSLVPPSSLMSSLAQEVEKSYLTHYIDIWESLVDNISLNLPKNLTETDALIMNLISTRSPLLQLLQTIHNNTDLEPIVSNSSKLQALNHLFNQAQTQQKDSLYQIFVDLHELHMFLQNPLVLGEETQKADSPQRLEPPSSIENNIQTATTASFIKEKQKAEEERMLRIHAMAEKYPEPIKNWLQTLVTYTKNYLEPKAKVVNPMKVALLETAKDANAIQDAVILTPMKSPSPQDTSFTPAQKKPMLAPKRATSLPKKTPILTETKIAPPSSPEIREPSLINERKLAQKQGNHSPSEYVRVLADNKHPLIFVQKD